MKLKPLFSIICFILFFLLSSYQKSHSQCFQIESILVDACGAQEGFNEMVRFKVGATPLNTSNLSVVWPNLNWQGVIQNSTTQSIVQTLNADIIDAGGCAELKQPIAGVLPANANVILVTSYLMDTASNSFGALTEDTYIIFQNHSNLGQANVGHFANYGAPGNRTLVMSFGTSCSDTVTYNRNLLINPAGVPAAADGAIVNFNPAGVATYINNDCSAPVPPFTVNAVQSTVTACAGTTITLNGNAQGQQSINWSAPSGTFSSPSTLSTNYTIPSNAAGTTIQITLTATNSCALSITDTVNVIVTPSTVPTFNPIAPICQGQTLSPLPTTSSNGVMGTWAPALNNMATTTYTFTPNTGQCATTTSLVITVNSATTIPTFTAVSPICQGQTLSPLPTTSNNGVLGTWAPALNNMATTTYTFTPNAGQCAATTTLVITVNSATTIPTFTAVAPICTGETLMPLPTTSNNGITGTWVPALNNTATTTYTFTPTTGQCATTTTMTINVNTTTVPTFTQVTAICQGGTLSPLSLTSNNGITGTWAPALNNTTTTTYTFTPTTGQCATTTTMTINVNTATVPTFTEVTAICQGGTLSPLPLTSNNGITGAWAPTLNNTATTTYTFTPTTGQCATTTTMTINVNTATVPTFTQVTAICQGGTLSPLPLTSNNGITGTWAPALNNTATTTYTFTPTTGQCATTTTLVITVNSASTIPTFMAVAPICQGQTLNPLPTTSDNGITGTWAPALDNLATTTYTFTPNAGQCAVTTTLIITVNSATTVPTFTAVAPICTGETLTLLPTTSNNGITGTWAPALDNLATTTYTFTPNAGQCAVTTTLIITVNSATTVPTFTAVAPICTGETLTPLPTTSNNGITGTWAPALNNSATTTYSFTPNAGQCATTVTLTIVVTDKINPVFTIPTTICNGLALPDLDIISDNGISGTWSPSTISGSGNYIFTPNANQCALPYTLNISIIGIDFEFTEVCRNGSFFIEASPLSNSFDLENVDYQWQNISGGNIGSNEFALNVTELLNSTSEVETFPITYELTITTNEGCFKTKQVEIFGAFCNIPKGVSPNNDGKNDEWDLTGLGVKEVTIFNRYGTEVYHYKNYTNQWKGQSNKGEELPDGTYFYVIDQGKGQNLTGWVYLNKAY